MLRFHHFVEVFTRKMFPAMHTLQCLSSRFANGGVFFSLSGGVQCEEESVRLVGGHSFREGRVQVCHSGEWQSVCADRWSETAHEASVVCSQLGYPGDPGRAILVKKN